MLVKYPRTYHLPWSNPSRDDRTLRSVDHFVGQEVVVTEKLDGENTSIYRDWVHARSLEKAQGPTQSNVQRVWLRIGHEIPDGWRVCGENVLIKHSIHYQNIQADFQVFSVWTGENVCLSWDDTVEWAAMLGLVVVPVLYRGLWDEKKIRSLYIKDRSPDLMEGYVVRNAGTFSYDAFQSNVAKFVRPGRELWAPAGAVSTL